MTATWPLMSRAFAILAAVGPEPLEVKRMQDLIESLSIFEPRIALCVLVDDCWPSRNLGAALAFPPNCRHIEISNPRGGLGHATLGGLCVGILAGLAAISDSGIPLDFVMKIDPDALIIKSFQREIEHLFSEMPGVGLIGAMGRTCRREAPDYGWELHHRPEILRLYDALPEFIFEEAAAATSEFLELPESCKRVRTEVVKALSRVRKEVAAAAKNGYCTMEYCQGGAYALSAEMLSRMTQMGYLGDPTKWAELRIGEDVAMGLYARAVGLDIRDFSAPGQPFGVQFNGLPYHPSMLEAKGYSIVHSTKGDPNYSEQEIRAAFARARRRH